MRADITVLAGSTHLLDALDAFDSVLEGGKLDRQQYDYFESLEYGSSFRKFIEEYGYYDLMLITLQGDIVYSILKEKDLTRNMVDQVPSGMCHCPASIPRSGTLYCEYRDKCGMVIDRCHGIPALVVFGKM